MSVKQSTSLQIRLPKWAIDKMKIIAEKKGLAVATTAREIICESLN